MRPDAALADLFTFLDRTRHCQLVVVSDGDDGSPVVQRLNLSDDVASAFHARVQATLYAVPPEEIHLREYEPGYKCDRHEVRFIRLADYPQIASLVDAASQIQKAELFTEEDQIIDALRFYVIAIGASPSRRALFFRSYSRRKELSRSGVVALMLRKGSYDRINERVFLFDDDIDCFAWDGFLFITNVHYFQQIFRYFEMLRQRAAETLDAVAAHVPIVNMDAFRDACLGHIQMMSKITQIARKPYLGQVTIEDIKKTIQAFNLGVTVVKDGDGSEKLLFENSFKNRWLILKLLDDDFLGSTMTKQKYEVNSKSAVGS